jgi:hypothetical protein
MFGIAIFLVANYKKNKTEKLIENQETSDVSS